MYSADLKPLVVKGLTTLEATRKWLKSALRNEQQPTAIFALNHRTSHHVLHALAEEKIRIPKQIALIGFDDFDLASVLQPPLTVVAQSPAELAKRAIELLLEQIRQDISGPAGASSVTILLPAELVIRASCGSDDH
jgi:LacI family transcriptional regulator